MIIPVFGQMSQDAASSWISSLSPHLTDATFKPLAELSDTERSAVTMAVVANPTPEQLRSLPNLKWVQSVWAGVEKLVDTFADSSIRVTRLVDPQLSATMSECALTWCLYINRDMHRYEQDQKKQHWEPRTYRPPHESTVGLLGYGQLGASCAEQLTAYGFKVSAWSRSPKTGTDIKHYTGREGLVSMVQNCQILINLLPLTSETNQLLNSAVWQHARSELSVINFGRGATVTEADLIDALDNDKLSFAVLDVFDQEPLPEDHPYWHHPKIRVLPHISAPTSIASASEITAVNIRKMQEGIDLPPFVDFDRGY